MPDLPSSPDITPKHLWNPWKQDFKTIIAEPTGNQVEYIAPSQEISTFPAHIRDRIAERLARFLTLDRGIKTNFDDEYSTLLEEIKVSL